MTKKTAGPMNDFIPARFRSPKRLTPDQADDPREVVFDRPAQKDVKNLPGDIKKALTDRLAELQQGLIDPDPKQRELAGVYTIRLTTKWRAAVYLGVDDKWHCFWVGPHNYDEVTLRWVNSSIQATAGGSMTLTEIYSRTDRVRGSAEKITLPQAETILRRALADAGYQMAEQAKVVLVDEPRSYVGFIGDLLAMDDEYIPVVYLARASMTSLVLLHEVAHLLEVGGYTPGRPMKDKDQAHDARWFDIWHRLVVRYGTGNTAMLFDKTFEISKRDEVFESVFPLVMRGSISSTAMPSWRDRGAHPEGAEAVIAPDVGRSRRNSYVTYIYGEIFSISPTLQKAKESVTEIYGDVQWTKVPGDQIARHDPVWGLTRMFNDAPVYYVVERLPRLGVTGGRGASTVAGSVPDQGGDQGGGRVLAVDPIEVQSGVRPDSGRGEAGVRTPTRVPTAGWADTSGRVDSAHMRQPAMSEPQALADGDRRRQPQGLDGSGPSGVPRAHAGKSAPRIEVDRGSGHGDQAAAASMSSRATQGSSLRVRGQHGVGVENRARRGVATPRLIDDFKAKWGRVLTDPMLARDRCIEVSEDYARHLRESGVTDVEVVNGMEFGEMPEFPGVRLLLNGHFATRVGREVWDWTARQFDPSAPVPLVQPLSAWRKRWTDGKTARTASTEEEYYRGVGIWLHPRDPRSVALLQALASGSQSVARDRLVELLGGGSGVNTWNGERNRARPGAGGWWTTDRAAAYQYGFSASQQGQSGHEGMGFHATYTGTFSAPSDTHEDGQGHRWPILRDGDPITLTEIEASLPTRSEARRLLAAIETQGGWTDPRGLRPDFEEIYEVDEEVYRFSMKMKTQAQRTAAASTYSGQDVYEVDLSPGRDGCVAFYIEAMGMPFPAGWLTWERSTRKIEGVWVADYARGKGIGAAMLEAAGKIAGGALKDSGEHTNDGYEWAKRRGLNPKRQVRTSDSDMARMNAQMMDRLIGGERIVRKM